MSIKHTQNYIFVVSWLESDGTELSLEYDNIDDARKALETCLAYCGNDNVFFTGYTKDAEFTLNEQNYID